MPRSSSCWPSCWLRCASATVSALRGGGVGARLRAGLRLLCLRPRCPERSQFAPLCTGEVEAAASLGRAHLGCSAQSAAAPPARKLSAPPRDSGLGRGAAAAQGRAGFPGRESSGSAGKQSGVGSRGPQGWRAHPCPTRDLQRAARFLEGKGVGGSAAPGAGDACARERFAKSVSHRDARAVAARSGAAAPRPLHARLVSSPHPPKLGFAGEPNGAAVGFAPPARRASAQPCGPQRRERTRARVQPASWPLAGVTKEKEAQGPSGSLILSPAPQTHLQPGAFVTSQAIALTSKERGRRVQSPRP